MAFPSCDEGCGWFLIRLFFTAVLSPRGGGGDLRRRTIGPRSPQGSRGVSAPRTPQAPRCEGVSWEGPPPSPWENRGLWGMFREDGMGDEERELPYVPKPRLSSLPFAPLSFVIRNYLR